MAITLTTSPQIVGKNEASTIRTYLYAWYDGQSGNSCTVHTRLTVISAGITYTGANKAYFMELGRYSSGVIQWSYAPLNANQEYTVAEASWSYSGGEQIYASAGFWSYVYGSADISLGDAVYVPSFNTPPSGLSASIQEIYTNGAKISVSLSSYGSPSGVNGRYIEAAILAQNTYGGNYRYNIASNVNSSQITVTNSSYRGGGLTIQPNTRYWYGAYASNTAMSTYRVYGQFTTKAVGPSVQFIEATDTTATLSYSVPADGGAYSRGIQYRLSDSSSWHSIATVEGGSANTGTFVINNLLSGTAYTVYMRVVTGAGTTEGEEVSFNTVVSEKDNKNLFYGSVNGVSKEISKLYGGVNGESQAITKLYGAAIDPDYFNFGAYIDFGTPSCVTYANPATFNAKMISSHPDIWEIREQFGYVEVDSQRHFETSSRIFQLKMALKNGRTIPIGSGDENWINEYGIFVQSLPLSAYTTREGIALVNRTLARLIYQAFRRINYS